MLFTTIESSSFHRSEELRVVVADGITWTIALYSTFFGPLAKNQFYEVHSGLAENCAIIGCENEVMLHREIEEKINMSNN
jgi:hypothetical protein